MFSLRTNGDPNALWMRYGIALFIILAFLGASHLLEVNAIGSANEDSAVINTSGKQRLLSQKIILHAQDVIAGKDPNAEQELLETVASFETAHNALMRDAIGEESMRQIYLSRTPSTDELVKNYIVLARSIPTATYPQATFSELKEKGSGIVLERLDEAVSAFEARAKARASFAHKLQDATLFMAALVVIFEALVIFLPAHRLVQRSVETLQEEAQTDPLTRLRNRSGFDADVVATMTPKLGNIRPVTLVLIDLDDFKGINDRHGHAAGDAVLKAVAERIGRLPNLLSVARVGGDEFAVLVDNENWHGPDSLAQIHEDMRTSMSFVYQPVQYEDRVLDVAGSVGISRFTEDAKTFDHLLRNASASLRQAKETGRNSVCVFNKRIGNIVQTRCTIQSEVLSGAYKNDLNVVFQPIVQTTSRKISSVEALARWNHPDLGFIAPPDFLTIARECGKGAEMERHLRAMALEQMAPALNAGLIDSLSLNVSPLDLGTEGFADAMLGQLAEFGVASDQIWVEIIESVKMPKKPVAKENLEILHAAGIRIALDDYGVGFSNIRRLAELPIQRLKIDKSVIDHIEDSPKYAGVFRSSVQMARALGAEVVAEGVETAEQLDQVKRYGCRLVQGYYFFKPMPAEECMGWFGQRLSFAA